VWNIYINVYLPSFMWVRLVTELPRFGKLIDHVKAGGGHFEQLLIYSKSVVHTTSKLLNKSSMIL